MKNSVDIYSPIRSLAGVGPKLESDLERLGIYTVGDLLTYYPRDYEGDTKMLTVAECKAAPTPVTLRLKIRGEVSLRFVKRFRIVSCTGADDSGRIALQWFNQPYIKKVLKTGGSYIFRGVVKSRGASLYLSNPKLLSEEQYGQQQKSLLPIYPLTKGISSQQLQKLIRLALSEAELPEDYLKDDILPGGYLADHDLMRLDEALNKIHFAAARDEADRARRRMVFDEFLLFMLEIRSLQSREKPPNTCRCKRSDRVERMLSSLPYELTGAQRRTIGEIYSDIFGDHMMNRLVQGDVGSGKTIVAFAAMLTAADSGFQSALMAPTEVLARQHYEELKGLLAKYGMDDIGCVYLAGSMTGKEKEASRERIADGSAKLVIGTHALIQEKVSFKSPGLVITDEQHRFGVRQRMRLAAGGGESEGMVHTLVMSATPIPRTLAIIIYGDLDISLMDELPAKRLPIKNCVVGPQYRPKAYEFILRQVREQHQALVICPLAAESENFEAENVLDYAERLREELSPDITIEPLHGRMKGSEKNEIMSRFADGDIDVLVSTTVVEVGVNVPNTTVMMVENAERFGLAQLHQLRGRVGRGEWQSYCIFMCTSDGKEAAGRLEILKKSNDGFKIAEEDLKQRGPGDMFGLRQSGDMSFKIGDIYSDAELLKLAAAFADKVMKDSDRAKELLEKRLDFKNKDMIL